MRAMYARRVGNGDASAFDAAYAPSDIALAGPLGTRLRARVRVMAGLPKPLPYPYSSPGSYHENLLAWLALRHRPNVMIVWFEA